MRVTASGDHPLRHPHLRRWLDTSQPTLRRAVFTMERQEFEALQARVHKMERRPSMTLLGWATSLTVLVVLWGAVQQATSQPAVLRARAFEVTDELGRVRIVLDAAAGEPRLQFRFW